MSNKSLAQVAKAKAVKKLLKLNKEDPSLSTKELYRLVKPSVAERTFLRWISDLKKSGKWTEVHITSKSETTNVQQVDNELEELATKFKALGETSKAAAMRSLGISRRQLEKVIKYIAGSNEVEVRKTDTISTTDNNVVSVTPAKGRDILPCNVYTYFDRNGDHLQALVLEVEGGRVRYLKCKRIKSSDPKLAFEQPVQECSVSTFKKFKGLEAVDTCLRAFYILDRAGLDLAKAAKNKDISFIEHSGKDYDFLIQSFGEAFNQTNNSKDYRNPLDDDGVDIQTKEVAKNVEKPAEKNKKVEISIVERLAPKIAKAPYKLSLSEKAVSLYSGVVADTVNKSHRPDDFKACLVAIEAEDWAKVEDICKQKNKQAMDYKALFESFGFTIIDGFVQFGEGGSLGTIKLPGLKVLMNRVEHYARTGDDKGVAKIAAFIEKLTMNPDEKVMSRVVDFIKFKDVEIDEDGNLLVYKVVNSNYRDKYTNKVDNSIGSVVRMRRTLVDADESEECSRGLHVCALSYIGSFHSGNCRVVRCKLSPEHIVSIPADYKGAKIRACQYEVVSDVTSDYVCGKLKADTVGEFADAKE